MLAALVRLLFALALFCSVSWAQAALLVTYTFQDVVFDDGGTLNGWATFDPMQIAEANDPPPYPSLTYSNVAPHEYTSAPTIWVSGANYQVPPLLYHDPNDGNIAVYEDGGDFHLMWIFLHFAGPTLDDRIGRVPIGANAFESDDVGASDGTLLPTFQRYIISGAAYGVVVSVPEPETYAMISVGLVLIGAISARSRR